MNRFTIVLLVFLILIITMVCGWDKPFAGETGIIKKYVYDDSEIDLIIQLDQLLLQNPEYEVEHSLSGYYIFIKHIPSNNKFGLRVFKNNIRLIYAGENGKKTETDYYLKSAEKNRLILNFEEHIIKKTLETSANKNNNIYVQSPFLLTLNKMDNYYTEFIFVTDTLLQFRLPIEFNSLTIDYYRNLLEAYENSINIDLQISQHCNLFSLNKNLTGFIDDSITVTKLYRKIGQAFPKEIIFESNTWSSFTKENNAKNRIEQYLVLRKEMEGKRHVDMAYWMNKEAELKCEE